MFEACLGLIEFHAISHVIRTSRCGYLISKYISHQVLEQLKVDLQSDCCCGVMVMSYEGACLQSPLEFFEKVSTGYLQ